MEDPHHRHLARGTVIGLVGTVGMGVVNFFLRRHWALSLDTPDFSWFYCNYVLFFFAAILVDLGGANYSTIAIAKHHANDDAETVSHIFFSTALYKVLSGFMGTALAWVLAPWLADHYFHYDGAVGAIRLMAFFFPLFCLEGHLFAVLCSLKAFFIAYGTLLLKFMLILLAATRMAPSIRVPPLLFIGGSGLFCLLALVFIMGSGSVRVHARFLSLRGVGKYLVKGIWLALFNISAQSVLYVDQMVATVLLGVAGVAVYNIAVPIVQILYSLLLVIPTVSTPVIASMWQQRDPEPAIAELCKTFFTCMLALLWCVLLVTVPFAKQIIIVLFSEQFVAAGELLPFLTAGIVLYITGYFFFSTWNARRKNHTTSIIMLFAPLISLALCLVLIPRVGLRGAAIAACSTHGVMCLAACTLLKVKLPAFTFSPLRSLYISACGVALLLLASYAGPVETLPSRPAGLAMGSIVLYLVLVGPVVQRSLRAAAVHRFKEV